MSLRDRLAAAIGFETLICQEDPRDEKKIVVLSRWFLPLGSSLNSGGLLLSGDRLMTAWKRSSLAQDVR